MAVNPTDNISKKVKALPYDENDHALPAMIAAIVSGNEVIGYLPLKATDNGDGTASLDVNSSAIITFDKDIDIGDIHLLDLTNAKINPATQEGQLSGVAEHHNGSATVTPETVTFSGTSKSLLIENRDSTNDLLVSFDGDANTKTISSQQTLSIEANHASVRVSSSAGTVAYEMLVTV